MERPIKYEKPCLEVIEFVMEDSIASSADYGSNVICTESFFGQGGEE